MCLYHKTTEKTKKGALEKAIKIAKCNIIVFKAFNEYNTGVYSTPFRGFKWPNDKTVKVSNFGAFKKPYSDTLRVEKGLHAYTKNAIAKGNFPYKTIKKMIIPKGAQYIIGTGGEIVSLEMKIYSTKTDKNCKTIPQLKKKK